MIHMDCRFDYPGDVDYFEYTPTACRYYDISFENSISGCNMSGSVMGEIASVVPSNASGTNDSLHVYLCAKKRYYIKVYDANGNVGDYKLLIQ